MEEWLPVVGFEGRYEVSSFGRVRNVKTGTIRVPNMRIVHGRFYATVDWNTNGRKGHYRISHLVLEAFDQPRVNGLHALHCDDDSLNNCISNLYWGTNSDNMLDKVRNGNHHHAKLLNCRRCDSPLDGDNLYVRRGGARACRKCRCHMARIKQGYYLNHPDEWPSWAGRCPSSDELVSVYRAKKGRNYPMKPRDRVYRLGPRNHPAPHLTPLVGMP